MKRFGLILLMAMLSGALVNCGGRRLPTPKAAQSKSLSYFKRYGKKFPTTSYNKNNISNFTINSIEEVSYRTALVDGLINFVDGHTARLLVKMENKFPQGWSVSSWEMIGYR